MEDAFDTALSRWLTVRSLNTKPATCRFYGFVAAKILRNWSLPSQSVKGICVDDVLAFARRVTDASPSYWNSIVNALRYITPHGQELKLREMSTPDKSPPSQTEFAVLIAECDRLAKSKASLVVQFLAHTGMRITEAKQLRWGNIFDDRIEAPGINAKNGKPRSIPMIPGLPDVLAKLRLVDDGSGYVLPQASVRRGLATACQRAGLRRYTHHDFRHLFATRAIESGVDVPTVARWLGHRDGGALLSKRYFHLLDAHSKTMAGRVKIAA